jgi:manganese/iron transport system permease protein
MILGVGIGVFSSISGKYLSYFYNLPSGPAIVLVASGLFILAFLLSPSQGVLTYSASNSNQSFLWRELKQLVRSGK